MLKYSPELTLREARALYFEINNFPNGGYDERWVKMKAGPFPIWFPNIKARQLAVRFHDLHHILTEYETTWKGETEIGAWEVATGIGPFWVGWVLDLLAFAIGLVINPRGVYRAFMRGRHSANLYHSVTFDDALLAQRVGAMRRALRLEAVGAGATSRDVVSFIAWSLASVAAYAAAGVALLATFAVVFVLLLWASGNLVWPGL
ncbi:MAG: hypothetical protein QOF61_536 [Acidobacteriota bacterium]|nr:hypothetical protein [Acidobacteriota bacterium]